MCSAKWHVRFTPNSDRKSRHAANGHVCFTPEIARRLLCALCCSSFPAMSPRGSKQRYTVHRVEMRPRAISPDDLLARLNEVSARNAADTRTEAQRWLGDPHPARSALAQVRARPAINSISASAPPRFASWSQNMSRLSREK
jgi:hypothetical protein